LDAVISRVDVMNTVSNWRTLEHEWRH
jgi:hypothetical protein